MLTIKEKMERLSTYQQNLFKAITDKVGYVSPNTLFKDYVTYILNIRSDNDGEAIGHVVHDTSMDGDGVFEPLIVRPMQAAYIVDNTPFVDWLGFYPSLDKSFGVPVHYALPTDIEKPSSLRMNAIVVDKYGTMGYVSFFGRDSITMITTLPTYTDFRALSDSAPDSNPGIRQYIGVGVFDKTDATVSSVIHRTYDEFAEIYSRFKRIAGEDIDYDKDAKGSIYECIIAIIEAKAALRHAIVQKQSPLPSTAPLREYPLYLERIYPDSASAIDHVVTTTPLSGQGVTGNPVMVNRITLSAIYNNLYANPSMNDLTIFTIHPDDPIYPFALSLQGAKICDNRGTWFYIRDTHRDALNNSDVYLNGITFRPTYMDFALLDTIDAGDPAFGDTTFTEYVGNVHEVPVEVIGRSFCSIIALRYIMFAEADLILDDIIS